MKISKEIINTFKLEPVMRMSCENFIFIADLKARSSSRRNIEPGLRHLWIPNIGYPKVECKLQTRTMTGIFEQDAD